jgi:hypothetical protein
MLPVGLFEEQQMAFLFTTILELFGPQGQKVIPVV